MGTGAADDLGTKNGDDPVGYRPADVDSFKVLYREARQADAQNLPCLHGLLSASHMFRDLIPRLPDRFQSPRRIFLGSVNPKCRREKNSARHSTNST
jgi:hypothetical protein